jgi:hypothetical protein
MASSSVLCEQSHASYHTIIFRVVTVLFLSSLKYASYASCLFSNIRHSQHQYTCALGGVLAH